jgi:hypothetical protein
MGRFSVRLRITVIYCFRVFWQGFKLLAKFNRNKKIKASNHCAQHLLKCRVVLSDARGANVLDTLLQIQLH